MNKTLYLAWQDKRFHSNSLSGTRRWFPVGKLDKRNNEFEFSYIQGASRAEREAGFKPLASFPDLHKTYRSSELFELFKNRVPRNNRTDFPTLLKRLDLTDSKADPVSILAISGGFRQTDNLEAFPKLVKNPDNSFSCRFFLRGWRYMSESSQERLTHLQSGETLQVALELNNPATGLAIQLQTADHYQMIGWTPQYLVNDLVKAIGLSHTDLTAQVVQVNQPPAPENQRVLVSLSGKFPESYQPMESADFKPIAD